GLTAGYHQAVDPGQFPRPAHRTGQGTGLGECGEVLSYVALEGEDADGGSGGHGSGTSQNLWEADGRPARGQGAAGAGRAARAPGLPAPVGVPLGLGERVAVD